MNRTLAVMLSLLAAGPALAAGAAKQAQAPKPDVKVVEGEGDGAIVDNDMGHAKDQAKDRALRDCVEKAVGTMITSDTAMQDNQILHDKVYANTTGYVRRYDVLESKQDDSAWTMRVKCEVSEAKLDEDLMAFGVAYRREGMPRVMVLIAEQSINATKASGWWQGGGNTADLRVMENSFMARMENAGFTFVDPDVISGKVKLEAIGADPNVQQAREIGKLTGAELVVIGRAVAQPLGEVMGQGLYNASYTVSARAVATDSGEVLAAVDASGTLPCYPGNLQCKVNQADAGSKALEMGGQELARQLFAKVGKVWAKRQSGGRHITLGVRGVDDYTRLTAFKNALSNGVRGVSGVEERSLDNGRAELDVTVAGTSSMLATELSQKKWSGFKLAVKKVSGSVVEVELK